MHVRAQKNISLDSSKMKEDAPQSNARNGPDDCGKRRNVPEDPIFLRSHKNHSTLCAGRKRDSLEFDFRFDQNTKIQSTNIQWGKKRDSLQLLDCPLDQNTRRRKQYEGNSGTSTSDILTELITFSPKPPSETSLPNLQSNHGDDKKANHTNNASHRESSDLLAELVEFTPIDFDKTSDVGQESLEHSRTSTDNDMEVKMVATVALESLLKDQHAKKNRRPFVCQVCLLPFKAKSTLKEHLLVHSKWKDRKTYGCRICKLCFATKSQLQKHVKNIHTVTILPGQPGSDLPVVGKMKQSRKKQTEVIWLQ